MAATGRFFDGRSAGAFAPGMRRNQVAAGLAGQTRIADLVRFPAPSNPPIPFG